MTTFVLVTKTVFTLTQIFPNVHMRHLSTSDIFQWNIILCKIITNLNLIVLLYAEFQKKVWLHLYTCLFLLWDVYLRYNLQMPSLPAMQMCPLQRKPKYLPTITGISPFGIYRGGLELYNETKCEEAGGYGSCSF